MVVATTTFIPDILSQNDGTDSTTSSPSLDCGYLNNSYTFLWMTYNGECCNSDAVEYMDTENPGWRTNQQELQTYMLLLFTGGYCNSTVEQSTAVLTSTTTVPETTTTEEFNCYWLEYVWRDPFYNGECCNWESVNYLNGEYDSIWTKGSNRSRYIKELRENNICGGTTTSTTIDTTATTESSSTILTTEVDLKASRKYGEYTELIF